MVVGLGVGILAVRTAAAAETSDPAKAEELIRQANDLRRRHMDGKALPLFREAYEISRTPRSAAQLGLAEMALGYWDASNEHLTEALTSGRNPWVETNRKTLEGAQKAARSHLSSLTVQGTPAGAEVVLNHRVVGTLPLSGPVLVNEGQIDIEVRAAGYKTDRRVLTVEGASNSQATISLEAEAPVAKSQPPRVEPAPKPEAAPPPADKVEEKLAVREASPAAGELPTWRRVLPWSLAATAVAVGALGVWQQTSSSDALRQFEAIPACGATLPNRGSDSRCNGLYDQFSSRQTNARVGYAAAGVLAVGAIGVIIWNAASAPTGASVALGPGEVRLAFSGSF